VSGGLRIPTNASPPLVELIAVVNTMMLRREPQIVGYREDGGTLYVRFLAAFAAPWVQVHVQSTESGKGGLDAYDPDNYVSTTLVDCRSNRLQDISVSMTEGYRYVVFLVPVQYDGETTKVLFDGENGVEDNMASVFGAPAAIVRVVPNSVTDSVGSATGSVGDVATMFDGNVFEVAEVTGVPGYDIRWNFLNGILTIPPNCLVARVWYDGGASHLITIQLYDYDADDWVEIHELVESQTYQILCLPFVPEDRFMNESDEMVVRFYHNDSGDASHHIYFDYVGLWRIG
jgi:hypothetical protein